MRANHCKNYGHDPDSPGSTAAQSVWRRLYVSTAQETIGRTPTILAACRVNDLLCADIPDGRFVTAVIGLIDPAEYRVEMLSAGQALLLFYESATATLHNWDADELPLGIADGLEFGAARQIAFAPGDMLVLTTDGFFEATNAANEPFGIQTLEQFIRDHHHVPPGQFIAELYGQVKKHVAGEAQADDLTALVIKRTGSVV